MTGETGSPGAGETGSEGPLYCYRCKNVLKLSPEWCGTCGADQFYTCRSCGRVFNKTEMRCPACGVRRRRSSHRSGISRVSTSPSIVTWFERNRGRLFYISAGVAGGILVGAIVKSLASHSGPANEQGYEITSLMYWLDPFIRAATTVYRATLEAVRTVFKWTTDLILNNFKTTILAFIGGVAGFILAAKRERERRRAKKHRKSREAGSEDPGPEA